MVEGQTKTPLEFRLRVVWIGLAYFAGFFFGEMIQEGLLHGGPEPTIVVLGSRFGQAGIEFFAWLAVAFVVAAWLVRWWGSSYHSPGVVMSGDVVTDEFTVAGPYRYVRNPLYLGNVLLAIGIGALGPPPATVFVIAFNAIVVYRLIAIEERFLKAANGDVYARYCAAVPRLLPRLTPISLRADARRPDIAYGFVTELFVLGFVGSMIYFVVVVLPAQGRGNSFMYFWVIAGVAVIVQSLLSRRARQSRGLER
ncbi:MAG TPA: isoprenylcysteine carboxylmethyltransferase family protein [Candidatus Eremiobacteraceae bacterium]|nr:isoprenylcysteine carboxylmethyltransferase family protein [Candidatus Eremiobacteraceae bacterium]